MRRRQLLASGALLCAVPLAGCAHPPNVLDMSEASDQDIAAQASESAPPESDLGAVMADAVANGTTNVTGSRPPVSGDRAVEYQSHYYNVSVTELRSRQAVRYNIQVDYNPGDVTPQDGEIAYDSLPDVDRDALEGLIPPNENAGRGEGYDIGVLTSYPDDAVEQSVLVPDQQYDVITYEGEGYRIRVERRAVSESDYRVEATLAAETAAAYADIVRNQYLFTLSGLSADEREVVESAIEDGYFEEATEPFRSVIARFLSHRAMENGTGDDGYGRWLLEYEETEYLAYAEYPTDITPRE